jgi:hypothetical protein
MRSTIILFLSVGWAYLLTGCTTDIRVSPDHSMAFIKGTGNKKGFIDYEVTSINAIDGKMIKWPGNGLSIAPGKHNIGIGFSSGRLGFASGVFPFELEAGKVYRFEVFTGYDQKLFLREVLESTAEDLTLNTLPLAITPGSPTTTFTTIMIYRRK